MDRQRKKTAVAWLSVGSNTLLVLLKLVVGLVIGSVSVISEAIHSGVDLVAALIALFAVQRASRPPDSDHHFGHGKLENVSGTVEALLIFVAAAWILYEAVHKLLVPTPVEAVGWGVAVMGGSALANYFVSRMLFKVGRETDSVALQADGWHLRTDVYTSAGVMLGLLAIVLGRFLLPGTELAWIDPVAAIVVGLLILHAAWRLTLQAGRDLLDASLPAEELAWIDEYLRGLLPEVHSYHRLRTRKSGSTRFIDLHLQVDPGMSVQDSHGLAHRVVDGLQLHFGESSVTVHVEPAPALAQQVEPAAALAQNAPSSRRTSGSLFPNGG